MKTTRAKVTLDFKDITKAVEKFYNGKNTGKVFHGNITFCKLSTNNNAYGISFEVETDMGVDVTRVADAGFDSYCKLRHKGSGLYLNDVTKKGKSVGLICNHKGKSFTNFNSALDYIRKTLFPYSGESIPEEVKDRLLQFEVINFGEKSVDDMTFHIDVLGNS